MRKRNEICSGQYGVWDKWPGVVDGVVDIPGLWCKQKTVVLATRVHRQQRPGFSNMAEKPCDQVGRTRNTVCCLCARPRDRSDVDRAALSIMHSIHKKDNACHSG